MGAPAESKNEMPSKELFEVFIDDNNTSIREIVHLIVLLKN